MTYFLICDKCKTKRHVASPEEIGSPKVETCHSCQGGPRYKCAGCGYLAKLIRQDDDNTGTSQRALDMLRKQIAERKKELDEERRQFAEDQAKSKNKP